MTTKFTKVKITIEDTNRVVFELFTESHDYANECKLVMEFLNDITLWANDRYNNKPCTVWVTEISESGFVLNTYCDWYVNLLEDYGVFLTKEYTDSQNHKVSTYEIWQMRL